MNNFIEQIIKVCKNFDYTIYEDGRLNLIGIRARSKTVNVFNDSLFVIWKENNEWIYKKYIITTEPGLSSLLKPINKNGCAILVEGQYVDTYTIDIHALGKRSQHEALCQRLQPVRVYRDNNKNSSIELSVKAIEPAYGINIHRASGILDITAKVEAYSAGCQVFQSSKSFKEFMDLCKSKRELHNNRFTYTLINEKDLLIEQ